MPLLTLGGLISPSLRANAGDSQPKKGFYLRGEQQAVMGKTGWIMVLQPPQHSTILLQGRNSATPNRRLHRRRLPESGAPVFGSQGCGPEVILFFSLCYSHHAAGCIHSHIEPPHSVCWNQTISMAQCCFHLIILQLDFPDI